MGWELVNRDDVFEGSESPFVSISGSHFTFNVAFARQAEITPSLRVTVYVDSDNRKIGFDFHPDNRINSFSLAARHAEQNDNKRKALTCSSTGIMRKYSWIAAVAKENAKQRRFLPMKEACKWVIQLCPAFEEHRARESAEIPCDIRGIYRYRRDTVGKIVYIGRGCIKDRLQSLERKDWDFDVIEYSIVENPDEQVKWEGYWIERFKEENHGELPFYNRVSGSSDCREATALTMKESPGKLANAIE